MATSQPAFTLAGDKLPGDARATRYRAVERISAPYAITVEIVTSDTAFVASSCLRARACLTVVDQQGRVRFFDGIVDRASFLGSTPRSRMFELRLVPALSALAHREGSRIFQEKTSVVVVQTIFKEAGFGDKVE